MDRGKIFITVNVNNQNQNMPVVTNINSIQNKMGSQLRYTQNVAVPSSNCNIPVQKVAISTYRQEGRLKVWTSGIVSMTKEQRSLESLRKKASISKVDVSLIKTCEAGKHLLKSIDRIIKAGLFVDWLILKCEASDINFQNILEEVEIFSVSNFNSLKKLIDQSSCLPLPFVFKDKEGDAKYFFLSFNKNKDQQVSKLNNRIFFDAEGKNEILVSCDIGININNAYVNRVNSFRIYFGKELKNYVAEHSLELRRLIVYHHLLFGFLQEWLKRTHFNYCHNYDLNFMSQRLTLHRKSISEVKELISDTMNGLNTCFFLFSSNQDAFYLRFTPKINCELFFVIDNIETPVVSTTSIVQYYRQFFYINDRTKTNALDCLLDYTSSNKNLLQVEDVIEYKQGKIKTKTVNEINGAIPELQIERQMERMIEEERKRRKAEEKKVQEAVLREKEAERRKQTREEEEKGRQEEVKNRKEEVENRKEEVENRKEDEPTNEEDIMKLLSSGTGKDELIMKLLPLVRKYLDECFEKNPVEMMKEDETRDTTVMLQKFQDAVTRADKSNLQTFLEHIYNSLQLSFTNSTCQKIMNCMIYKEMENRGKVANSPKKRELLTGEESGSLKRKGETTGEEPSPKMPTLMPLKKFLKLEKQRERERNGFGLDLKTCSVVLEKYSVEKSREKKVEENNNRGTLEKNENEKTAEIHGKNLEETKDKAPEKKIQEKSNEKSERKNLEKTQDKSVEKKKGKIPPGFILEEKSNVKTLEKANEKLSGKSKEKIPEKSHEKPPEKCKEKILEKSHGKPPEKCKEKIPEKSHEKPPEKCKEKMPEKSSEKTSEKSNQRTLEKSNVISAGKNPLKPSEKCKEKPQEKIKVEIPEKIQEKTHTDEKPSNETGNNSDPKGFMIKFSRDLMVAPKKLIPVSSSSSESEDGSYSPSVDEESFMKNMKRIWEQEKLYRECMTGKPKVVLHKLEEMLGGRNTKEKVDLRKRRTSVASDCSDSSEVSLSKKSLDCFDIVDGRVKLRPGYECRDGFIVPVTVPEVSVTVNESRTEKDIGEELKKELVSPKRKTQNPEVIEVVDIEDEDSSKEKNSDTGVKTLLSPQRKTLTDVSVSSPPIRSSPSASSSAGPSLSISIGPIITSPSAPAAPSSSTSGPSVSISLGQINSKLDHVAASSGSPSVLISLSPIKTSPSAHASASASSPTVPPVTPSITLPSADPPVSNPGSNRPSTTKSGEDVVLVDDSDEIEILQVKNLENKTDSRTIKLGTTVRLFKCGRCHEQFKSAELLGLHETQAHGDVFTYKCNRCSKRFYKMPYLELHKKVKHEGSLRCELCDVDLKDENALEDHLLSKKHNEEKKKQVYVVEEDEL